MKKRIKRHTTLDKIDLLRLANPLKVKILEILKKEQKQNQLDIQKKLKISYKGTRRYINDLNNRGFIKKKLIKKKRGSPIFISLRKKRKR